MPRTAAPPNIHLERFVPHDLVMPGASAVITHAGLGTVQAALRHGVPLVCLPIGRDQPDNAARVAWHGAGVRLSPKSTPIAIRQAVGRVLGDPAFAASARRLAAAFAEEQAADRGPKALESLATRAPGGGAVRRSSTPLASG
jgi:UDP:flavonoid glycosyltransferase YjiC (YdhE family)